MSPPAADSALILIVDDYADAREMYAELLDWSGFATAQAADGAQAVALTLALRPSLVLMDLSLPVLDGWEAIRRIRANPQTASTPVLTLSGHSDSGSGQKARQAGADDWAVKPCEPDVLLEKISRLLRAPSQSLSAPG